VATAVQLRLNVYALRLSPPVFRRLKELAGSKLTAKGELVLTARRFRTQEANRTDARERLSSLIRDAHKLPEKRAKTRLNRVGKEQRLKGKKLRGAVKSGRGRVRGED
jgi:ribosome-associated protein